MIEIRDKADCCGCTACAGVCAHDAITMKPDAMGFIYPVVDRAKCVDCGLCEKVCAFNDNYDKSQNLKEPEIYATRHKDIHEVETSRSGAAFIAISDYILDNGGIVYGVGYKDHFRVVHKRAATKDERNEFKGSKYVQSYLDGIFKQVKEDLKKGYTVLFSGTPCQTAGLNSFVGKKLRENLILVDIVCHGVPSPYIWRDYLTYIENKYKSKVVKVDFRDKSRIGWSGHIESFIFENGNKIESVIFKDLFLKNLISRPSCSVCHFANFNRPSDFTIGDYWGWNRISNNFNSDNKGCSLLFINSQKGHELFKTISHSLNLIQTNKHLCTQPNLEHPSVINEKADEFINDYQTKGFKIVISKYSVLSFHNRIILISEKIKRKINRFIKIR